MAERRIAQTTPRDSSFLTQRVVGGRPPSPIPPEICAQTQSDPRTPFKHQNFDQYPLIVPQP